MTAYHEIYHMTKILMISFNKLRLVFFKLMCTTNQMILKLNWDLVPLALTVPPNGTVISRVKFLNCPYSQIHQFIWWILFQYWSFMLLHAFNVRASCCYWCSNRTGHWLRYGWVNTSAHRYGTWWLILVNFNCVFAIWTAVGIRTVHSLRPSDAYMRR